MISHKYQCIFIHIPKCAGTSIESALEHLEDKMGRGGQDHRSIRMIEKPWMVPGAFSSAGNILEVVRRQKHKYFHRESNHRNKYEVTKDQYDSYFKFTFVRNPWDRAFSWYRNVMIDKIHQKNNKIKGTLLFKDFLKKFAGKGMLKPQTHWIRNFKGAIPIDYIGYFESLSKDIENIFQHLNLSHIKLPHMMKGEEADYREHYDDEAKDIISNVYKEEIEMFGYSFGSYKN